MWSTKHIIPYSIILIASLLGYILSRSRSRSMRLLHGLICGALTFAFVRTSWKPKPKLQDRIAPRRIAGRLQTSARFAPENMSGQELFRMGQMWRLGLNGMGIDVNRAMFFYNKSLERGYTEAYVDLGLLHQEAKRDALTAIECYLQAIAAGHLQALFPLARLYEMGVWPHFKASKVLAIQIYELCIAHEVGTMRRDAMIRLTDLRVTWNGWNAGDDDALPWSRDLPGDILGRLRPLLPEEPGIPEEMPLPVPDLQRHPQRPVVEEEWVWQIPFFDIVQVDAVIGDAVFAAPDHRGIGDSQNVHDTAVLGETKAALQNIQANTEQYETKQSAVDRVQRIVQTSSLDTGIKEKAQSVLRNLTDQVHSKLGMSEKEVLSTVLNRIDDPVNAEQKDNLTTMLVQNLADGVQDGMTVCSTGRAVRIASTLDSMDAENVLSIRPTWAINEEIGNSATAIKNTVLAGIDDSMKQAYEKPDPTEEEQRIADEVSGRIKEQLKEKCHKDYVQSGILNEDSLQARLQPYLDAIE